MIPPSRWSLRDDQPRIIPHRAAAHRATPTLHLEWHVNGERISRHGTVTSALLHQPPGGVLMVERDGRMVAWAERRRA